ncbi:unnamed protein product (macronuclear) [Paramecium tetraurelia]|uniref:Biogenesis of lysosome-related organelles complex 1 subunit 7 n=2 Tax=Paramecium TaxID=5884 RepID=A0E6U9_PARTE|nr:uncharacterized protein GSPATT00023744001 [Paramecium tetraurelia]CAD8194099.1 unnamed protein product [Paramecium octaurelia]CAK91016.1 unnamed protein product [Paramecium tetraurelia]|eukprot:XP_001458413.1 hypothetical protein (macronuclear) [Paramecium tetraurelia strain d4-2]
MDNKVQEIFEKLLQFNSSDELQAQQAQLEALLTQIKDEMQMLIQDTHFGKDQYYLQQFERIADSKKRLDQVNAKMVKIQQRVDVIEKRFIKLSQ